MEYRPFTLEPKRWYARQFHGEELSPGDSLAYSPIHLMLSDLTWHWPRTHFGILPRGGEDVQRWRGDR